MDGSFRGSLTDVNETFEIPNRNERYVIVHCMLINMIDVSDRIRWSTIGSYRKHFH